MHVDIEETLFFFREKKKMALVCYRKDPVFPPFLFFQLGVLYVQIANPVPSSVLSFFPRVYPTMPLQDPDVDHMADGLANTSLGSGNSNDSDDRSVQSYQPSIESSDLRGTREDDEDNDNDQEYKQDHPRNTRRISIQDATSIIGGSDIKRTLSRSTAQGHQHGKFSDHNGIPKTHSQEESTKASTSPNASVSTSASASANYNDNGNDNDNDFTSAINPDTSHGEEETYSNMKERESTKRVFNFSMLFSSEADTIEPELNLIRRQKFAIQNHLSNLHHQINGRHDTFPHVSKTIRRITKYLPFKSSHSSGSKIIKKAAYPKAPLPPSNVKVYWEDIQNDRCFETHEHIRSKLERQESLSTIEEAKYYRDTDHYDDGKMKALRDSIINNAVPMQLTKSIGHKFSSLTSPTTTNNQVMESNQIPQPQERTQLSLSKSNTINSSILDDNSKLLSSRAMSPAHNNSLLKDSDPEMEIYDQLDGDVLVLGGYRGSILRDSHTHQRAWIPVIKAGLNIRKINLQIGPHEEDELNELNSRQVIENHILDPSDPRYPKVYPDGMLTHIGPVDISKKLIKRLNLNPRVHARDWGYDWRLSPELTARQLHDEIEQIVENQKDGDKKGVILIAHSMGGIVAHGAMVLNPKLVRGIIYAGTPMPCCNVLGPLRFSDSILLNKEILSNEVNFFIRSSFVFLPPSWGGEDEDGKNGGMCLFRDLETGKRIKVDFWDPWNWVEFNLNPLVSSVRLKNDVKHGIIKVNEIKDLQLRQEIDQMLKKIKIDPETELIVQDEISKLSHPTVSWIDSYTYLKRTLSKTKKFLKSFERDPSIKYPPLAQVFSNSVPSIKYSLVNGLESIKRGEYYRFFYGPGDGIVYSGWTFPRDINRHRLSGEDKPYQDGVDPIPDVPNWRAREYGYGEKYAFDLCGRFKGTCGHIGLLADLKLVGQALKAIRDEELKRSQTI